MRQIACFSGIAGITVFIFVVTALYNVVAYVGSVVALVHTSYGHTISIKIALLLVHLFFAAYNRYVSVPDLGRLAGLEEAEIRYVSRLVKKVFSSFSMKKTEIDVVAIFKRAVRFEAFLMLGFLFCAALLRHEIPARHAIHADHTGAPAQEHMHH